MRNEDCRLENECLQRISPLIRSMEPLTPNPTSPTRYHACVDVYYHDNQAIAACVVFTDWRNERITHRCISRITHLQPYKPGRFYERELPCILQVLKKTTVLLDTVVIDGYVWLDNDCPGLGAHLYSALGGKIPVIGVAKSKFKEPLHAQNVFRGKSRRPLYVTAAGIDPQVAAECIRQMHGRFRIPTLLKTVDSLCRNRQED